MLSDGDKRALAAQILGQAYVSAYNLVVHNKDAVEQIADELVVRREVFGDELVEILDGAKLTMPEIDYANEDAWPTMMTLDAPEPEPVLVLTARSASASSYRLRFGLIYVFLAVVVGAGVGSFIVLASEGDMPDELLPGRPGSRRAARWQRCARSPTGSRRRTAPRTARS